MTSPSSDRFLVYRDAQLAVLLDAVQGVSLTEADRRLLTWLGGWETGTVEALAGLIRRARRSAPDPGSRR